MNLLDSHIHDNRVILPPDPDAADTGGHWVQGAMVRATFGDVRFENLVFENNTVDDLDSYDAISGFGYVSNNGREMMVSGDTLRVNNVLVRNSRIANPCPEMIAGDGISYCGPGHALSLAGSKLEARNVVVENSDDGGLIVFGDSVLVENLVLRNVGRAALLVPDYFYPDVPVHYHFRNILVDNVDASLNQLGPQQQQYSEQAVLHMGVVGTSQGVVPRVDIENMTVTGCDGMRHLFNFYEPVGLHVRNSLFFNNNYQHLVEMDDPITQDWQYNLLQENVPGQGNLIGLDPRFDGHLGPPFLAADSPCIDAGDPDPVFNDIEDLASPGFPRWPALGTLRNDMGFTGGPHAVAMDTSWVSMPHWQPIHLPQDFELGAPWPNPFNPVTHIPLSLERPFPVRISVYNLLGQEVAVLLNCILPAGTHHVPFQAGKLASGVYVVTAEVAGRQESRSVTLIR